MLDRQGRPTLLAIGQKKTPLVDLYHEMLVTPWRRLLGLMALTYVSVNAVFASLYMLGGDCVQGARRGHFADYFFFSVHTTSTIGYGSMWPKTLYAHSLVTVQVLLGMMLVALGTGLAFAKFARPSARVRWSRLCVIRPFDGVPTLMFRMANERANQIVEARLTVNVVRDEVSSEGERLRRFHPMRLVRESSPLFALSWTALHPIDEQSPLHGRSLDELRAVRTEILVAFAGTDETFAQTVHARNSYTMDDLRFDHRFVDIMEELPDGRRVMHYDRFDDVEPLPR